MYLLMFSDIDECTDGAPQCHSSASCVNTIGSYTCSCGPGFNSDGFNCSGLIFSIEI